jgi:hypothetical protein
LIREEAFDAGRTKRSELAPFEREARDTARLDRIIGRVVASVHRTYWKYLDAEDVRTHAMMATYKTPSKNREVLRCLALEDEKRGNQLIYATLLQDVASWALSQTKRIYTIRGMAFDDEEVGVLVKVALGRYDNRGTPVPSWAVVIKSVQQAVGELDPKLSDVVLLSYGGPDLSQRQIAKELRIAQSEVSKRLHKGLRKIATAIKDDPPSQGGPKYDAPFVNYTPDYEGIRVPTASLDGSINC